jgi:wyosine [tRNA(Phe)-imidazoG37] synthetase (radical SAM superfamily)
LTLKPNAYVPAAAIKLELEEFLKQKPQLDFITFSGSGEPTLYSEIDTVVEFIKTDFPQYQVALLTNGTLLGDRLVSQRLQAIDLIIASLDAATPGCFERINRPHSDLNLDSIIEGMINFQKTFPNQFWLEIFLLPGINDSQDELKSLKSIIQAINPDKIQINTLDRPGTEPGLEPMDNSRLNMIAEYLDNTEIIKANKDALKSIVTHNNLEDRLLTTIRRRPSTIDDLYRLTNFQKEEIETHVEALMQRGAIESIIMPRGQFYVLKEANGLNA